jgi:hypothetical protein
LIRKTRGKEKQNKQAKNASTTMTMAKWAIEREFTRQQQTNFIVTWSSAVVKEA